MAFYLDTSAAVKLVVAERGSKALLRWMSEHEDRIVSSDLLRTELQRATRRGSPQEMERARAVLESITVMTLVRLDIRTGGGARTGTAAEPRRVAPRSCARTG